MSSDAVVPISFPVSVVFVQIFRTAFSRITGTDEDR